MTLALQYHIEAIRGGHATAVTEAHILNGDAAEWQGSFGRCLLHQMKTSRAIFRAWTLETNSPVCITPVQDITIPLLLFAREGALILHAPSVSPIIIPSSTLFIQSAAWAGQSLFLSGKGVYQFLSIRILDHADHWNSRKLVPGLFMERLLGQLFILINAGKNAGHQLDNLLNLILQEAEGKEFPEHQVSHKPVRIEQQIVEEMRETMILQMDERFSVNGISGMHHMHPARLTGLFKKVVGRTPAAYQRDIRIQKARQLLKDKRLKIQDIALELGFVNPGHFSKFFKTRTGISPSLFRSQHREGS